MRSRSATRLWGAQVAPAPVAGPGRPSNTLEALLIATARDLKAAGMASPSLDARLLVGAACGLSHEELIAGAERTVGPRECAVLAALVARRVRHEPVSRILGKREFWSREFLISEATLDPRPDTECLVEAALDCVGAAGRRRPLGVLDLGTGSGCILLSLLAELPRAWGLGLDRSAAALDMAVRNASRWGLADRASFVCGDWLAAIGGEFDLVVANPPYIPSGSIDGLAPEVADHDPRGALDGGEDGLNAYRAILPALTRVLKPRGWVLLEVGDKAQAAAVATMLAAGGLAPPPGRGQWRDLSGAPRCVLGARPAGRQKKDLENAGLQASFTTMGLPPRERARGL